MSLSANVNEKANLIWAIADKLTGVYKPHEYGEVILPLTVIRRFDCILAETKDAVLAKYEEVKKLPMKDVLLRNASGKAFYNTSKFTFERLLDDPDNIEANFRDYLNGFSENVQDILEKFKFDGQITTMANKDILYIVIKEFTSPKANLHPNVISNLEMGYIFEEIIRRFSESHNEDAGQHYTPREVIQLMVNILFYDDNDVLSGNNVAKTLYDPACGTGGMLSVAEEYLHKLNASTELMAFGQELNDQTFAICKADMLIKGNNAEFIKDGNTLSDDQFEGQTFDYILSNPPFGREWKNEKAKVEGEAKKGFAGRFGYGLPPANDGQMLFLMTAIAKMKDADKGGSRIAIIHNGSPLFNGDAGSGPSEIRKYILENDLLEAIIALPNDIFYNTGIATYIWVLSNKKSGTKREGKVQLINANELYEKRRKALGNKRNDIPENAIAEITRLYGDFVSNDISLIFDTTDFGYTKIVVERPVYDEYGKLILKNGKKVADVSLRDTEKVPLKEDVDEYFSREVLPFASDAWIDRKRSKIGYEIPFSTLFFEKEQHRSSDDMLQKIEQLVDSVPRICEKLSFLNPMTDPMKETGINSIGEVPANWTVSRLKYVLEKSDAGIKIGPFGSALRGKTLEEGPYKIYNQANLISNDFSYARHFIDEDTFKELKAYEIQPGDILLSMMGTIGKCKIMPQGFQKGIMDSHLLKARLGDTILPRYFEYVYDKDLSHITFEQLLEQSNGSIMNGLNSSIVKNVSIPVPSLEEQEDILEVLDEKCKLVDDFISVVDELGTVLREYKLALVRDVSTGKKR